MYEAGRRDAEADMAARWARTAAAVRGPAHAELEERRWGPGGREHFADARPGDFPGRDARQPEPEQNRAGDRVSGPDPDPAAPLAAQVEDLRGELAEFRRVFSQWDAKLQTEGIGGTMTLLLEVKHLRERLDDALAKRQLEPVPAPWWCVGEARGKVMLAELRGWVEEFLRPNYPGLYGPAAPVLVRPR